MSELSGLREAVKQTDIMPIGVQELTESQFDAMVKLRDFAARVLAGMPEGERLPELKDAIREVLQWWDDEEYMNTDYPIERLRELLK